MDASSLCTTRASPHRSTAGSSLLSGLRTRIQPSGAWYPRYTIVIQGVLHNNIKPLNISYSRERGAVLLDFKLATTSSEGTPSGCWHWYVPLDYITDHDRGSPADGARGYDGRIMGKLRITERTSGGWTIHKVRSMRGESYVNNGMVRLYRA